MKLRILRYYYQEKLRSYGVHEPPENNSVRWKYFNRPDFRCDCTIVLSGLKQNKCTYIPALLFYRMTQIN